MMDIPRRRNFELPNGPAARRIERGLRRVLTAALGLGWLLHPAPLAAESERPPSVEAVYRTVGDEPLRAYVFQPPERLKGEKANAILLFHGGGWSAGEHS